jgi:4-hydroxybenzoate polyprenyltransferase
MFAYLKTLRPKHWIKNCFLFAAPFFGGSLFHAETLRLALPAFLSFSFVASAGYIVNDIRDIKNDRVHPQKKKRPITSGLIGIKPAFTMAAILLILSCIISYGITSAFLFYVFTYFVIQILYSLYLKNLPIIDVFCIASGFVIRVLAGGVAFDVAISSWLLLTMLMISLVLAAGKRLCEVNLLHNAAEEHRKSLNKYSISTLNEILIITSATSLIAYSLYTVEQFHRLIYTVPVVSFGLFRYLMLSKQGLGDPTEAMTQDRWLAATVALWVFLVGLLRYG